MSKKAHASVAAAGSGAMPHASIAAASMRDSLGRLPGSDTMEESNAKKNTRSGLLQFIGLRRGEKDNRNTTNLVGAAKSNNSVTNADGGLLSNIRLIEDGRGFHSSELVIKAFKCAGLIESDLSSSSWLPADLTEAKNKLHFTQGAVLGPEQLLIPEKKK